MPVVASATSARRSARAPRAISRATSSLTAPTAIERFRAYAELCDLHRVTVRDESSGEALRRSRHARQRGRESVLPVHDSATPSVRPLRPKQRMNRARRRIRVVGRRRILPAGARSRASSGAIIASAVRGRGGLRHDLDVGAKVVREHGDLRILASAKEIVDAMVDLRLADADRVQDARVDRFAAFRTARAKTARPARRASASSRAARRACMRRTFRRAQRR